MKRRRDLRAPYHLNHRRASLYQIRLPSLKKKLFISETSQPKTSSSQPDAGHSSSSGDHSSDSDYQFSLEPSAPGEKAPAQTEDAPEENVTAAARACLDILRFAFMKAGTETFKLDFDVRSCQQYTIMPDGCECHCKPDVRMRLMNTDRKDRKEFFARRGTSTMNAELKTSS